MARRRMFSLDIIDTDIFQEMPQTSRLLYYELCMRADDDGFVSSPKKIQKMVGCSEDDLKVLIAKQFIIPFDTGIVVIKHWKIHNYIRNDRYKETIYQKEKSQLNQDKSGMYTNGIPNGYQMDTQVRLGKDSIGKDSIEEDNRRISDSCGDGLQNIIDFYNNNIGILTPYGLELLKDYLKDLPSEVIIYAMQISVEADKRSIKYIKAILNAWINKKITTLAEAQKESKTFKTEIPKEETAKEEAERLRKKWGLSDED